MVEARIPGTLASESTGIISFDYHQIPLSCRDLHLGEGGEEVGTEILGFKVERKLRLV